MKGKGGGKFKYMSEKDMLELAAKFAPYRYGGAPFSVFLVNLEPWKHCH